MITTLVSIAAFALLFALFGALRPRAGCDGRCAGCRGTACSLQQQGDRHD